MKHTCRILLGILFSLGFQSTTFAEMLFWQLSEDSHNIMKNENIQHINYLVLDKNNQVIDSGKANNHPDLSFMTDYQWEFNWNDRWNNSEYTFMIEFVNYDNNKRWVSETASYSDVVSSGAIRYVSVFNTSYFHGFTNFRPTAMPEPSSGILCIIGMCVLMLKRKKVN